MPLKSSGRAAGDVNQRARRGETLTYARSADPIPITEAVMNAWAELVIDCRTAGIQSSVKQADALIAATSIAHGLPVVTQNGDFNRVAGVHRRLSVVAV